MSFKSYLKEEILNIPMAKEDPYKNGQIILRCPFCGDSRKSKSSRHMNIRLVEDSDEPIIFHCFRCDISGLLTPEILRVFDIRGLQLSSDLKKYNNESLAKMGKNNLGLKDNNYNFKIPIPKPDDQLANKKKRYIENRLGISLENHLELASKRIIFSLADFLKVNNINNITVSREKAIMLNNDYIGFLTTRQEFIIFRDITGKNKLRYIKYNIYNSIDNTRKFYTIPNKIDILTSENIYLNIFEGTFDALGGFYNINNQKLENQIYVAVCGCGFKSVIDYFIRKGLIGNLIINIYSDQDKNIYFYKEIYNKYKDFVKEMNVIYNLKSKDVGVSKDQIELKRIKI